VHTEFCIKQQSIFNRLLHFVKTIFSLSLLFVFTTAVHSADIDIDKLLQTAKKQNKNIMFFHHIPGCPYCTTMIDENFKDESTLKEINENFIYVDIYTKNKGMIKFKDFKGSHKEFSAYLGAIVYPSTIFMNDEGKIIHKAIGYRNIDEYFIEIKYISSKEYKNISFEKFTENYELEKDD